MKPGPGPIMTVEAVFFSGTIFLNFATCCFYLLNVGSDFVGLSESTQKYKKLYPGVHVNKTEL